MLTALLIIALAAVLLAGIGLVSVCLYDGGFFCWWFVVPEVCKGIGYGVAGLLALISEVNN